MQVHVISWDFYIALAESQDGGRVRVFSSTVMIIIGVDMQNAAN